MKTSYESKNPVAIRKRILVPKTNLSDDSVSVEYSSTNNRLTVVHAESADDLAQIQGDASGVYYHVKESGVWRTVPNAIAVGGTGGTSIQTALQNLHICYTNGDTWTINAGCSVPGYLTENGTNLYFDIETHRWMIYTSRIVINSFSGVLRGGKGYLDSNNTARNFKASPFSCTATRLSSNRLRLRIVKTSAFTNVDNNTPVVCNATWSLTFNT